MYLHPTEEPPPEVPVATAVFQLKPDHDWQPAYIANAPTTEVKIPGSHGVIYTFPITPSARNVTLTDPRAIRLIRADSRFLLISEF